MRSPPTRGRGVRVEGCLRCLESVDDDALIHLPKDEETLYELGECGLCVFQNYGSSSQEQSGQKSDEDGDLEVSVGNLSLHVHCEPLCCVSG